jgi:hypothetical protein
MTWHPLLAAPTLYQLHAFIALFAFVGALASPESPCG